MSDQALADMCRIRDAGEQLHKELLRREERSGPVWEQTQRILSMTAGVARLREAGSLPPYRRYDDFMQPEAIKREGRFLWALLRFLPRTR